MTSQYTQCKYPRSNGDRTFYRKMALAILLCKRNIGERHKYTCTIAPHKLTHRHTPLPGHKSVPYKRTTTAYRNTVKFLYLENSPMFSCLVRYPRDQKRPDRLLKETTGTARSEKYRS